MAIRTYGLLYCVFALSSERHGMLLVFLYLAYPANSWLRHRGGAKDRERAMLGLGRISREDFIRVSELRSKLG
jgi:hypothetical protein